MIRTLSPGLQQTIAQEEVGRYIQSIPFFRFAIFNCIDLKRDQRVRVKSWTDDGKLFVRPAVVTKPHGRDGMSLDVAYTDAYEPAVENHIVYERLACPRTEKSLRCVREVAMFIRELSLHVKPVSYMANETIVEAGISWNDELFIMVDGKAVVFDPSDVGLARCEIVWKTTLS